ncbi:hypothetical protein Q7P37_009665 [Cladosporium fusiforme]
MDHPLCLTLLDNSSIQIQLHEAIHSSIRNCILDILISCLRQSSGITPSPANNFADLSDGSLLADLLAHLSHQASTHDDASPDNTAQQAEFDAVKQTAAASESGTTVVVEEEEDAFLRKRCSSVYSRDTDGKRVCLHSHLPHMPSPARATSLRHRSLTSYSPIPRRDSASLTQPLPLPLPRNNTEAEPEPEPEPAARANSHESFPANRLFEIVKAGLRSSSMMSGSSSTRNETATAQAARESHARQKPRFGSRPATTPQEQTLQHQRIMRITTLGRLRRRISSLDFDADEMVVLRSDLTTLVPIPQQMGDQSATALPQVDQEFFRERLARLRESD